MRKPIFLIVGKTSSGKDSFVLEACREFRLNQLISYTTRPKRCRDEDTHIFIDSYEVEQYKDDMIAYTKIGDYEYFATKKQLKNSSFYIVDYEGIKWMRKYAPNLADYKLVTIYIYAPDDDREYRANARGDGNAFYKRCFAENKQFDEMMSKYDFDYFIKNTDYDKSVELFKRIIDLELNKII